MTEHCHSIRMSSDAEISVPSDEIGFRKQCNPLDCFNHLNSSLILLDCSHELAEQPVSLEEFVDDDDD